MSTQDINPFEPPKASLAPPSPGEGGDALLRLSRRPIYADSLRSYVILLDGVKVGRLRNGKTLEVPITSGPHTLVAKLDWSGSPTRHFEVQPGEVVTFDCSSNFPGLRVFLQSFYAIFAWNDYIKLDLLKSER